MQTKKLILIKHAMPEIDPSLPAKNWALSTAGKQSCSDLAQNLQSYRCQEIISSEEIKAYFYGAGIGQPLG